MEKYDSILRFEKYIVNNIIYKRNEKFREKEDMPISISIKTNVKEDKNKMDVNLIITIFKDAEQQNLPFKMMIDITGYFSISDTNTDIDFKPNAIAILYPYIRALVSTYTANANITPLILPAININKLLEEQENEEN